MIICSNVNCTIKLSLNVKIYVKLRVKAVTRRETKPVTFWGLGGGQNWVKQIVKIF